MEQTLNRETSIVDRFFYPAIVVLTGIVWINSETFLWRDDWTFLLFYYNEDFSFIKGDVASDVKPLFQYVMDTEFTVAGINFIWYQLVNVILFSLMVITSYRIFRSLFLHPVVAAITAVFLLLHPSNFITLLWITHQSELLHTLFVLMTLYTFLLYLESGRMLVAGLVIFFAVIQNYFFPNGAFLPLQLVVVYLVLKKKSEWNPVFIAGCLCAFGLHAWHAFYIRREFYPDQTSGVFDDLPAKALYMTRFISISAWRVLIPNFQPGHHPFVDFAGILLPAGMVGALVIRNKSRERLSGLLMVISSLIFFSATLSLSRYKFPQIHYYYTWLMLFPFCLLMGLLLDRCYAEIRKFVLPAFIFLAGAYVYFDYRAKAIFADRNSANRKQMEKSVEQGIPYVPFDDPQIGLPGYLEIGPYQAPQSSVMLYRSLKEGKQQ